MRTTVTIEDNLMEQALSMNKKQKTRKGSQSYVINEALRLYIRQGAALQLAALGGSEPDIEDAPPRRR